MEDGPWERKIGVRFTGMYTSYCKKTNRERIYSSPDTYRRNFLWGYSAQIQRRLREMRDEQGSGNELVLAHREGDVQEALYEQFPYMRPHESDCTCAVCNGKRKPVRRGSVKEYRYDPAASKRGQSAANNADLSGGRNNLAGRKRLEGGQ